MLYEKYVSKIQKIALVKNFIIKFRVVIIACLTTVIALTVAYTSSKGTLPNGILIAPSTVYGEKLEYSADAFLSEVVGYEFMSPADGKWVTEEPVHVGEYYIRAITEKVSGYRYSKPIPFKITPKAIDLTIDTKAIVYGSYPDYDVKGLEYGDQLSGLGFKFDSLTSEKTLVNPVLDAVLIRSTDGVDVTGNYTIKTEGTEITFLTRDITVSPLYGGKVYDGTNISYLNTYTITSEYQLGYEDKLEIVTAIKNENGVTVDKAIEPGTYTISIDKVLINGNEQPGNYDIETEEIQFVISKRELLVSTKDLSKTYDAEELKGNNTGDYFVSDNSKDKLLEGHTLALKDPSKYKSIIDCGDIPNEFEVMVVDANNNPLDAYYNISYDYGTLTVTQRDATISTATEDFTFDGESHFNHGYEISGLVSSHLETISDFASIINVDEGAIKNTCIVSISDGTHDVTGNYNIIDDFGTLSVKPAEIKVKPIISDTIYDGYVYDATSASYEIVSGQTYNSDELTILVNYSLGENTYDTVTNSDTYAINGYDHIIINGYKNNYSVSFEASEFTISKRDVKIELISQNFTFTGSAFEYPSDQFTVVDGNIIYDGDKSVTVKFTDIKGEDAQPIDVDTYNISFDKINEEVSRNHNVTCDDSVTLTIYEKEIFIKPYIDANDIVVYNGQPYIYNDKAFTVVDNNANVVYDNQLPWDAKITNVVVEYYQNGQPVQPVNAGEYDVKIVDFVYDGKSNYYFNKDQTTKLIIGQRNITIAPYILETGKVYDGQYYNYDPTQYVVLSDNGLDVSESNVHKLIEGNSLQLFVRYESNKYGSDTPLNADSYNIYGYEYVYSCDESDVVNYNIEVSKTSYVTYTIEKFKLFISPVEQEIQVYDGQEHAYDYRYAVKDRNGNSYVLESIYNHGSGTYDSINGIKVLYNDGEIVPRNVGTYNVTISEWYSDEITKNNYDVEFEGSIDLVIRQRMVAVAPYLSTSTAIYGDEFTYIPTEYIIIDMEEGYNYAEYYNCFFWDNSYIDDVKVYYDLSADKPVNRGIYQVTVASYEYHGEANYEFVEVPAEKTYFFEVLERKVVIAPYITQITKVYDGEEYVYDSTQYVLYDNGVESSLLPGNSLQLFVTYNDSEYVPVNAGTYIIRGAYYECDGLTENNYHITIDYDQYVTYTITPVEMSIKPVNQPDNIYYNGNIQEYIADEFEIIEGAFVGTDSITVTTLISDTPVNQGVYNVFIAGIHYANGTIEGNYSIDCEATVDFVVKARPITIVLNGQDPIVYDGTIHNYTGGYTVIDDLTGHDYNSLPCENIFTGADIINQLYYSYNSDPINVDTYEVSVTGWDVTKITNENYSVSFENVKTTMEIIKRVVVIAPYVERTEFKYDGKEHGYNNTLFRVVSDNEQKPINPYSLLTNDTLTLTVRYEIVDTDYTHNPDENPVNVGKYNVYLTSWDAKQITKQNYDIQIIKEEFETITISKRNVTVAPYVGSGLFDSVKIYNGEAYVYDANKFEIVEDEGVTPVEKVYQLLPGNTLQLGVIYYSSKTYSPAEPVNADDYLIFANENTSVLNELALRNYNIEYSIMPIGYKILPVDLIVKPVLKNTQEVYTGSEILYEVDHYKFTYGELVKEEVIKFATKVNEPFVNVGKYTIYLDKDSFIYENGAIPSNYNIDLQTAEFEITRRHVTISPIKMESEIYNGQAWKYDTSKYIVKDILTGEIYEDRLPCINVLTNTQDYVSSLDIRYNGSENLPINVGSYKITFVIDDPESLNSNYYITAVDNEEAILKIERRRLEIAPIIDAEDSTKVYDGSAYIYKANRFVVIDLDSEDSENLDRYEIDASINGKLEWGGYLNSVTVKYYQEGVEGEVNPTDYGNYYVLIDVTNPNELDNYFISASDEIATFSISKRQIAISLVPQQEPYFYSGEVYTYPNNLYYVYDVLTGETYESTLPCCALKHNACEYDKLIVVEERDGKEIKNVDTYHLVITGYDKEFIDKNYEVTHDGVSQFVISPKDATVTVTITGEYYYNGKEANWASNVGFTTTGFVSGEGVTVTYETDRLAVNAGTYTISPIISWPEGTLESNYILTKVTGDFTINAAQIYFVLLDDENPDIYDGMEHHYNGVYEIYDALTNKKLEQLYLNEYSNTQDEIAELAYMYKYKGEPVTPINALVYTVHYYDCLFADGTLSDNYYVANYDDTAEFEIRARKIQLAPFIDNNLNPKVYDGVAFNYYEYSNTFTIIDLDSENKDRYNIKLDEEGKLQLPLKWNDVIDSINVKYYQDGVEGPVTPIDYGDYTVAVDSWFYNGTNFNITNSGEKANVHIAKRKIVISLISPMQKGRPYNGQEFKYDDTNFNVFDVLTGVDYVGNLPCCKISGKNCMSLDKVDVIVNEEVFGVVTQVKNVGIYTFKINGYDHAIDKNYDVTIDTKGFVFEIIPADITITVNVSGEYYYCGSEVDWASNTGFTSTGFADGEGVELDYVIAGDIMAINANEYTVVPTIVWPEDGITLESNYSIKSITNGNFEIKKAPIKFVLKDAEPVTYDGKGHYYDGEYLVFNYATGKYSLDLPYYNEFSKSQDHFIELFFSYNDDLELIPVNVDEYVVRCVGWQAADDLTFNNYILVYEFNDEDDFGEGDDAEIPAIEPTYPSEPGMKPDVVERDNDNDYSDYADTAILEIKPRKIEITPVLSEVSKIFDANAFNYINVNPQYTVKDLTPDALVTDFITELPCGGSITQFKVLYKKLIDKENNVYDDVDMIVDAGTYIITFTDWTSDVKDNYTVEFNSAEYTISPRPISIMPYIPSLTDQDRSVGPYKGVAYVYDSNNYTIIDMDDVKYNNKLPCINDLITKITDVVVAYFKLDENNEFVPALPIDAGTYYVKVVSWNDGNTENYEITPSDEMIQIVIDRLTVTITYDMGTETNVLGPYIATEYELPNDTQFKYVGKNTLMGTDKITVLATSANPLINADTYEILINEENISFVSGNPDNYIIKGQPAYVIIDKASVIVNPKDQTHIYNGLSFEYPRIDYEIVSINGKEAVENKLLLGETIKIKVNYNVVNPTTIGTYTIIGESVSADKAVIDNYSFSFIEEKTLEITQRDIILRAPLVDTIYGQDYEYDVNQCIVAGTLGENDKLFLHLYFIDHLTNKIYLGNSDVEDLPSDLLELYQVENAYPKDEGQYDTYIAKAIITSSTGEDRIANYSIAPFESNVHNIYTNEITISLKNQTETYSGLEFTYNNEYQLGEGEYLIRGDYPSFNVYYVKDGKLYTGNTTDLSKVKEEFLNYEIVNGYPVDAGDYSIYISDVEIITQRVNNYKITIDKKPATLKINRRTVTYSLEIKNELVYNFGQLIPEISVDYKYKNDLTKHLVLDHKIENITYQFLDSGFKKITPEEIVDASTYYVDVAGYKLINGNSENYIITFERKDFTVLPLEIFIRLENQEKGYTAKTFDSFKIAGIRSDNLEIVEKVNALKFEIVKVKGVSDYFSTTNIVNVGVYNVVIYSKNDKDNKDSWNLLNEDNKASNFIVTQEGECYYTITPKTIDLTLENAVFTYKGSTYSYTSDYYSFTGIVNDQSITPVFSFTKDGIPYTNDNLIHYGTYTVGLVEYILKDKNGNVINDYGLNYVINYAKDIVVTIDKLTVTLNTNNKDSYYINSNIVYDKGHTSNVSIPDEKSLKYNVYYVDTRTGIIYDPTKDIINVGDYYILIDKASIMINNFDDYDFTVETDKEKVGKLIVSKAKINITYTSNTYTYGESHKDIKYECKEANKDILPGFSIELVFKYYKDGVLATPNAFGTYDAGTYKPTVDIKDCIIRYNGVVIEDKSNFEISEGNLNNVELVVSRRKITLSAITHQLGDYTSEAYERLIKEYEISSGSLVYGDEFTINTLIDATEMIHARKYVISFDEASLTFKSGNAENYFITYKKGYYQINRKTIDVNINLPEDKIYSGKAVDITWEFMSDCTPIIGDTIELSLIYNLERFTNYLPNGVVDKVCDAGIYTISVNTADYLFTSTKGSLQTDYYIYPRSVTYIRERKEIKIITPSLTTYYSGIEVTATEGFGLQEGSELIEGHWFGLGQFEDDITSVKADEICEEGKENIILATIFSKDGIVTDNYYVSNTLYGTITVLKRPIVIETESGKSVYNGSASANAFRHGIFTVTDDVDRFDPNVVVTELNSDVHDSFNITTRTIQFFTEGVLDNTFTPAQFKVNGKTKSAAKFFDIIEVYGTLELTRRDLIVELSIGKNNPEPWYTGKDLSSSYLTLSEKITTIGDDVREELSLRFIRLTDAFGNELPEPIEEETMIKAGLYRIEIGDVVITKRTDKNMILTDNYNIIINENAKELYITVKPLTQEVNSHSHFKVWDGLDLSYPSFHKTYYEKGTDEGFGLLENHEIRYLEDSVPCIPAFKDGIENYYDELINDLEYEIYDINTGEIVTENYNLIENNGMLMVVLYFSINDSVHYTYTGYNHTIPKFTGYCQGIKYDEDYDHYIGLSELSNLRYEVEVEKEEIIDIGSYRLTPDLSTLKLFIGDKDVTLELMEYLIVDQIYLGCYINRIQLDVKAKNSTKVYDGQYHSLAAEEFADGINYEIIYGSLLEGHYLEVTVDTSKKFTLLKPGDITSHKFITSVNVVDANGNLVNDFYDIDYGQSSTSKYYIERFEATLTVEKILLEIWTDNLEKTYNGKPFTEEQLRNSVHWSPETQAILDKLGHTVTINLSSVETITDYRKNGHKNRITITINEKGANSLYEKKYSYGTLTINQLTVTVRTHDKTDLVYNGLTQSYLTFDVISGLLPEHEIKVIQSTGVKSPLYGDQQPAENRIIEYEIVDKVTGADVTKNYTDLVQICGIIVVQPDYGT